jgi:hypothetical protein
VIESHRRDSITFSFFGLVQFLGTTGWEVSAESQAGGGYADVRLYKRAVLIELKSSEKEGDVERDANKALEQTIDSDSDRKY